MHISTDGLTRLRERVAVFRGFSDAELVTLLRGAERLSFRHGEVIFREGAVGDQMFVILAGEVMISRRRGEADPEELARLGVGDCFGEMGLIDSAPRSADATCVGDATVMCLRAPTLLAAAPLLSAKLFHNFASGLAARVRAMNEQLGRMLAGARKREAPDREGQEDVAREGQSDLRGGDFRDARLPWSDLRGADLRGADLRRTDLSRTDLTGASLAGADLRGADLRGANLAGANLGGVQWAGAKLGPADPGAPEGRTREAEAGPIRREPSSVPPR